MSSAVVQHAPQEAGLLPGLVSPQWLAAALQITAYQPSASAPPIPAPAKLRIFDASWFLPAANRDAAAEFASAHIPTATFFSIDHYADQTTALPHMIPTTLQWITFMRELNVDRDTTVVVYDNSGAFVASTRLWWTFKAFNHQSVFILDGGFAEWKLLYPQHIHTSSAQTQPNRQQVVVRADTDSPWTRNDTVIYTRDQIIESLKLPMSSRPLFLDARELERYNGVMDEPRLVIKKGHLPNAASLWHADVQTVLTSGRQGFRSAADLKTAFARCGVDWTEVGTASERLIVPYCGSGATAATLFFALDALGYHRLALYDASMVEWLNDESLPVETALGQTIVEPTTR